MHNKYDFFTPLINPITARIFTVFAHSLLEDRVLHKGARHSYVPISGYRTIKRSNFQDKLSRSWQSKG